MQNNAQQQYDMAEYTEDLEKAFDKQPEDVIIEKEENEFVPETKPEEADTTEETNDDDEQQNVSAYYQGLYGWYKEENLLPIDEGEIKKYFPELDLNSNEGFKKVIETNVDYLAEQKLKEKFNFLSDNQLEDFIATMTNGGKLADFASLYQDSDWETLNIKNNIANQKRIIREDYVRQGKDKEYIDDMIEMLENNKKLERAAESARQSLTKQITQEREYKLDLLKQQKQLEEQKAEVETQRFISTLKTTNTIANIPIDESIKEKIVDFKYTERPLYEDAAQTIPYMIDGQHVHVTPLDYALYNETPEQKSVRELLTIYLILNNYDLSGVTNKIRTKEISSLEKALKHVPKGNNRSTSKNDDLETNWK